MGKSTISMAIFNCYVSSPGGNGCGLTRLTGQSLADSPGRLQLDARGEHVARDPAIGGWAALVFESF